MNHRLQQFLLAENISQSQFADSIGVARASVSHILSGRNKPGFDFIENLLKRYPALNIEWLISGNGKMYKSTKDNTDPVPIDGGSLFKDENDGLDSPSDNMSSSITAVGGLQVAEQQKTISKIIVFYSDNSFIELK